MISYVILQGNAYSSNDTGRPIAMQKLICLLMNHISYVLYYFVRCDLSWSRYQTYIRETMPIIRIYESKGLLKTVSGLPPPDEVRKLAIDVSCVFL